MRKFDRKQSEIAESLSFYEFLTKGGCIAPGAPRTRQSGFHPPASQNVERKWREGLIKLQRQTIAVVAPRSAAYWLHNSEAIRAKASEISAQHALLKIVPRRVV